MGGKRHTVSDLIKSIESEISKGKKPLVNINCLQRSTGSTTEEYDVSYKSGKIKVKEFIQLDYGDGDSITDIAMGNLRFYLKDYKIEETKDTGIIVSKRQL